MVVIGGGSGPLDSGEIPPEREFGGLLSLHGVFAGFLMVRRTEVRERVRRRDPWLITDKVLWRYLLSYRDEVNEIFEPLSEALIELEKNHFSLNGISYDVDWADDIFSLWITERLLHVEYA